SGSPKSAEIAWARVRFPETIYRADESMPQMVVRYIGVLLGGIIILTGIGRLIVIYAPKAAFTVLVVLAVLVCVWIAAGVATLMGEWSAKKAQGAQDHLTNR
ncbi:MAG TPA: hypothetical protein VGI25_08505, partial [Candidatus Udaeobacter sp.]